MKLDWNRLRQYEKRIIETRFETFPELPDKYTCYSPEYVGFHSRRFAVLVQILEQLGVTDKSEVLDIGPTYTSKMFADHFKCRVDSLSFSEDEETPFGTNFKFDLNRAQFPELHRTDLRQYDVVVMAEVIEHLYTAPKVVMAYLRTLIKPGGYLVVQTPNALGLKMRIQLLLGKHPYEEISPDPESPNHYRENTLAELTRYTQEAGFNVVHNAHYNYFNPTFRQNNQRIRPWMGKLYFKFSDFLPAKMKRGLMVVGQNPKS